MEWARWLSEMTAKKTAIDDSLSLTLLEPVQAETRNQSGGICTVEA